MHLKKKLIMDKKFNVKEIINISHKSFITWTKGKINNIQPCLLDRGKMEME